MDIWITTKETHEMTVFIPDGEAAAQKVRDFLNQPGNWKSYGRMHLPFGEITVDPRKSWEDCQQALTRLWVNTGVLVEWSMPPRMTNDL